MSLAMHVSVALAVGCCWFRLLHFPLLTAMTSLGMLSPCSPQATSITRKQQQIRLIQSVMVFNKYKISNFLNTKGSQYLDATTKRDRTGHTSSFSQT
jgi:hypothetical protein